MDDNKQVFHVLVKPPREFEMFRQVSGFLEGTLTDWPANIAEPLLAELERREAEIGETLYVVRSWCTKDIDESLIGRPEVFYVHVTLSTEAKTGDIVEVDPRTVH